MVKASPLERPASEVRAAVTTEEGVNFEMHPLMRMMFPRSPRGASLDDLPVGEKVGRCWLLIFKVIPIDYDDLVIAERGPNFRFLERSSMLSMSIWQHEREVVPAGSGCTVTDRLSFEPRAPLRVIPGGSSVARWMVDSFFAHRHRRLGKRLGSS